MTEKLQIISIKHSFKDKTRRLLISWVLSTNSLAAGSIPFEFNFQPAGPMGIQEVPQELLEKIEPVIPNADPKDIRYSPKLIPLASPLERNFIIKT